MQECGAPNAPGGEYGREADEWQWWDDGPSKRWLGFEWAAQRSVAALHRAWRDERRAEGASERPPQGVADLQ